MSSKTTAQKLAKKLQRLAEDELGKRPKLMTCHNIVRDSERTEGPLEVRAAALFLANRDRLRASAEDRAARTSSEVPT